MIEKIISGAQTGVDTIGLLVGKHLGIKTGGTTTKNFIREKNYNDGVSIQMLKDLGVVEVTTEQDNEYYQRYKRYPKTFNTRTELNVINSDGTVYFATDTNSAGKKETENYAKYWKKPFILNPNIIELTTWLQLNKIKILNIAGNRGSKLKNQDEIKEILTIAIKYYNKLSMTDIEKEKYFNERNIVTKNKLIEWFSNMKPFKNENDIPSIPKTDEETYKNIIIPNLIRCGAIPKKDLIVGKTYLGDCRNASEAVWKGDVFTYKRTKFAWTYDEDINHFEDDNGYDLFVPIKLKD